MKLIEGNLHGSKDTLWPNQTKIVTLMQIRSQLSLYSHFMAKLDKNNTLNANTREISLQMDDWVFSWHIN